MKYGVLLIETGVPEDDSPEALRHYVDVVLGTGLYADKLGFVQSRLFRYVTIPAKRRDWRRYFYGDGIDMASTYLRHAKSLRDKLAAVYTQQTGKEPKIEAIHAGLECGLFAGQLPGLDCVSFGPDLVDIHTTREKMSISSVQRTWRFLLGALAALKD